MKYIKRLLTAVCAAFFLMAGGITVYAADAPGYKAVVIDEADLLTESQEMLLQHEMEGLLEYGNMVFQTVYLSTENYERYAEDSYYKMFGNQPGVLFQIDMGNRKLTLSASTDMEDLIGGERTSIVDNIYRIASDGNYYKCASECFHEIDLVLHDGVISHQMKHINNALFALILGLIVNFFLAFATTRKKVSMKEVLSGASIVPVIENVERINGKVTIRYEPRSSGGGYHGGGGVSRGGGGGGGFRGGSSSHGF